MKFAVIASAIAAIAPLVSAAGYQAAWTIKGEKCDGQISLGEYTATPSECMPKDCGAIAGVTNFSTKSTCAETHTAAAMEVLGANKKPYVLVEVYKTDSDCAGAFDIAIGVTADGTCYPGTAGKSSYNVTWSAETGTVWLQYDDAMCKGKETKVDFPNASADGKVCTGKFLKALAVAPSGGSDMGGSKMMESNSTMTMMPGATTMMPSNSTMSNSTMSNSTMSNSTAGNASTPASTTAAPAGSGASTAYVSVAAIATFAVAVASLI